MPAPDGGSEIAVVLVRPREEGNVGSAARAMANMGLSRLILVEPAAELGERGAGPSRSARGQVLDGGVRVASLREALAPFPRVVAPPRRATGGGRAADRRLASCPAAWPPIRRARRWRWSSGPRWAASPTRSWPRRPGGDRPLRAGAADAQPGPGGADPRLRALRPGTRRSGSEPRRPRWPPQRRGARHHRRGGRPVRPR